MSYTGTPSRVAFMDHAWPKAQPPSRKMGLFSRFMHRGKGVAPFSMAEAADPQLDIFRNLKRQQRLLPPDGSTYARKRAHWRCFLLLLVLYDSLAMPFQVAFWDELSDAYELPLVQCVLVYLIDCLFWLDMAIRFRTTYVSSVEEGNELITDSKMIARRYYHKGLVLDLLATIPIELPAAYKGILSLQVHALRLNRLLRASRIITVHAGIFSLSRFKRLCVLFSVFVVFAHWVACSWWALGNSRENIDNAKGYAAWMYRVPQEGLSLMVKPMAAQYFGCFYWAVTTLMKVPWIAPMTVEEVIFSIVLSLIGAITFALLIGEVTQIISKLNEGYRKKNEAITTMRAFCQLRKVPADVQTNIYSWLAADQEFANKYAGKQQALSALPKTLRTEVLLLVHKEVLEECPLTKWINTEEGLAKETIGLLATHLNPSTMLKKQVLLGEGSVSSHLYLLQRGSLHVAAPIPEEEEHGKVRRHTSKRMSTMHGGSPSNDRKSTKTFGRFRMLERPGCVVGLVAIDGLERFPFHVEATKLTHLMTISKTALLAARTQMSAEDAEKLTRMVIKEHLAHVEALKLPTPELKSARPEKNVETVLKEANALGERSSTCLDALELMSAETRALPELVNLLQSGEYADDTPRKDTEERRMTWARNVEVNHREEQDWEGLKEATQVAAVSATVM